MVLRYLLCVRLVPVYRKIINTNPNFDELMDPDITNTDPHSRLDVHLLLLRFYILLEALANPECSFRIQIWIRIRNEIK
jgi:hypothetical protein